MVNMKSFDINKEKYDKAQKITKTFSNKTNQEIFTKIYEEGLWGRSKDQNQIYFSGSGSHEKHIYNIYIKKIFEFVQSLSKKPDVVDLGCGDFFIGSQIREVCQNYIACDVVPELIEFNINKYSDLNVDFQVLDFVLDSIPKAKIVFIRQVLQHLSNEQILQLIPKLKDSFDYIVLTEHLPKSKDFIPNLDKPTGQNIRLGFNSGVVLTAPPFNLKVLKEEILCEVNEYNGIIQTILYKIND